MRATITVGFEKKLIVLFIRGDRFLITFEQRGDFSSLTSFLQRAKGKIKTSTLDKYGREGVRALRKATPTDTGLTAKSWSYRIVDEDGVLTIAFENSNIQNGVPIALIIQYGHATRNGGYVQGRDYINPAIQPIFDKILNDVWKEVHK